MRSENEINKLKAENEQLKEEIKEVKKYQYQQEYLDKEIEEMQKALKTLGEGLNKRQMILQKIKAIVEQWINSAWFCFNCRSNMDEKLQEILDLITKAEKE